MYIFVQVILDRTLKHAHQAAKKSGDSSPTPPQMELKLIQSKDAIETPSGNIVAEVIQ